MSRIRIRDLFCLAVLVAIVGCDEKNLPETKDILNSFEMEIDDVVWTSPLINGDSCYSTFYCDYHGLEDSQTYTIHADGSPAETNDTGADDFLRLRIAFVEGPGTYYLTDPEESLISSCVLLIRTRNGESTFYRNVEGDFRNVVTIEEMMPSYNLSIDGIRGVFSGVLFNIDNPNDSVVIENGHFNFEYMMGTNYYRCSY